ncbi:MAG: type II toxin-antitoxin system death-on-curing family toxin [Deltaproteobacteria bacterium]|nr:MAG: type II toxin-antitoxin system death-on-curing family toxin [Deltaproteobacteria bacterium]
MSREIVWIPKLVALRVHAEQLRRHGGEDGMLNERILDSALARARTMVGYLPGAPLEELAASMAVAIAKGHAFVDGNKRTACVVSLMFLRLNGIEISASEDDLAAVFEDIAAGRMLESGLAQWFAENTLPPEW